MQLHVTFLFRIEFQEMASVSTLYDHKVVY